MRPAMISMLTAACHFACGDAGPGTERSSVRDSAGITIIETVIPAWQSGAGWRLTASPALAIGQEEGDPRYLFARVEGAVRLPDGRIVVADGGSLELNVYDAAGRYVKTVGRAGEGPGEFGFIRSLKRCGVHQLTVFHLNWDHSVFTSDGEFLRKVRLLDPASGGTPYALACSRDGRFVITGWGEQTRTRIIGFYRATAPISVLDSAGALLANLGEYPSSERVGYRTGSRPHPFGRSTSVEIGPDAVYVGTGEALEVRRFALPGRQHNVTGDTPGPPHFSIIRGPALDLRITPEHLDRYRAAQLARASDEQRPGIERELRDMPLPPAFPAFTELKLDDGGNLWVRRFLRPGEAAPYWSVFDRDGVLLGDVAVPAGLNITEIGRDYVLGIHQDELGVERIQLYGLLKERDRG